MNSDDLEQKLNELGRAMAPRTSTVPAIMARVAEVTWSPGEINGQSTLRGGEIPSLKFFLWLLASASALASLISVPFWFMPRPPSIEQVGGIELVYAFNSKAISPGAGLDDIARRTLAVLKRRVDFGADRSVAWRIVDGSHIQVRVSHVNSPQSKEDLDEVKQVITANGVLDMRIAVLPDEIGPSLPDVVKSLAESGPTRQLPVNGTTARWFEIDKGGRDNLTSGGYIISARAGISYILCYDDHDRTLTHTDPLRKPWSIRADTPHQDPPGAWYLPFHLDSNGGDYLGELTFMNRNHPMAILLDDRAMCAPTIQTQINDSGQITFGTPSLSHPASAIEREVRQLKRILDAGALPAPLLPEPLRALEIPPIPGFRPFPWLALWTFGPIPILILTLGMLRKLMGKVPTPTPNPG